MKADLEKCFDESKTGVPVDKIERMIFCFTGKIDAAEENELAEACQENGVNLDLFGIDAFTFDLYSKHPALARDFLGIPIDTGQIVPPERFVSLYNDNKLATRLDLGFHFREEELGCLLDAFEDESLVILSGPAGVGVSLSLAQRAYLLGLIDERSNDAAFMEYLFGSSRNSLPGGDGYSLKGLSSETKVSRHSSVFPWSPAFGPGVAVRCLHCKSA